MKPCSKNRKQLALLAVDALDAGPARELRAHVETCAGCRQYLVEISNVTRKLAACEITPDNQTSESFHQRVTRSVRAEKPGSLWEGLMASMRSATLNWRVAVPVAAAIVVMAIIGWHGSRPRGGHSVVSTQPIVRVVTTPRVKDDLPPTFSNYRMAANRSLESFDDLLARQASKSLPSAPIYTAATLDGVDGVK